MISLRKYFAPKLQKLINYPTPSRFSHNSLTLLEESDWKYIFLISNHEKGKNHLYSDWVTVD